MSALAHDPLPERAQDHERIGVRALLSAGAGRPQVALVVPGVAQRVVVTPHEAAELAGRLLSAAHTACYEACVQAALRDQHSTLGHELYGATLAILESARERLAIEEQP